MPPLALVTGGCRRLGGAISAALARAGYALAIHASHEAEPDEALAAALGETRVEWRGFAADFVEAERATALYADVAAAFARAPDLLVNAASVFGQDRLEDVTAGDLAAAFAVHCSAAALLTQAFAASGRAASGGEGDRSIVNILDQRIRHPHRDQLAYTLAKLALAGLTRIGAEGVRVNGVAPGLTLPTAEYDPEQMARLAARMPLGVLPRPEDVAGAVLFCASCPAIDRQIVFVDAGAHLVAFDRDFVHLD